MTEKQLNGQTVFEFVIPTLTKDKKPIPSDRVESYIRTIESRSLELNGGFYKIPNCYGGYRLKSNEILHENNIVIRTFGKIPLTAKELETFADYLNQDCLLVIESGHCKAYLHEGGTTETTYTYHCSDGSFTEFSLETGEGGKQYVFRFDYDEDGMPSGGEELSEDEVRQMITEGGAELAGILQNFSNP